MEIEYFIGNSYTCPVVISFNANAAFINIEWPTPGV